MKRNSTLFLFFICLLSFALMSNSGGRANASNSSPGATGAPGDGNQTCGSSGCHSQGALDISQLIEILDANDEVVNSYIAGQQYKLRVTNTSADNAPGFGFQMVSLIDSDNSFHNAWSDEGDGVHIINKSGKSYAEHNQASTSGVWEVMWTAPAENSGDVTFYAAGNAVNLNGGTSGDGSTTSSLTVSEDMSSSVSNPEGFDFNISPNPTSDFITVTASANETLTVEFIQMDGKVLFSESMNSDVRSFDLSTYTSGVYLMRLTGEKEQLTKRVLVK